MNASHLERKEAAVQPLSLRQQVAAMLRQEILRGKYLPGDRIVEAEVASKLSISRGPVREAIRQLEEEGLVVYSNNKGCTVTTLEPQDAWEIYTLRSDLECLALTLCNGRLPAETLAQMEACLRRMEVAAEANDLPEIVEQDHLFHGLICQASGNKRLFKIWSSLNSTSYAIFLTVIANEVGSMANMSSKHRTVFEALRKGEGEAACKVVREHYLGTGRNLFLKRGAPAPE
jgi:DNA-binding GntR family transcriptional regulator